MKKIAILVAILLSSGVAFADGIELKGLITGIDNDKKTISINGTLIQVLPQTEITLDDCGIFGTDVRGKFVDLKLNSFVEAEVFANMLNVAGEYATADAGKSGAPAYIAEEIELKCVSNSAY